VASPVRAAQRARPRGTGGVGWRADLNSTPWLDPTSIRAVDARFDPNQDIFWQDVRMTEQWSTPEQIDAARERFERAVPGWQRPAAWAIGRAVDEDTTLFDRINVAESYLPAVILAIVCGHVNGSGSYPLTVEDLDRAIEMLAPAEACTEVEHPNLAVMRRLRADLGDDELAIVVFIGDLSDRTDDPGVRSLLDLLSLNHR
jgi:hypothetical protein